jgi:hypothetical protein
MINYNYNNRLFEGLIKMSNYELPQLMCVRCSLLLTGLAAGMFEIDSDIVGNAT